MHSSLSRKAFIAAEETRAARVSSAAIKAFLQSDARIGSINLVFFHGSDLDTFLEWNFF